MPLCSLLCDITLGMLHKVLLKLLPCFILIGFTPHHLLLELLLLELGIYQGLHKSWRVECKFNSSWCIRVLLDSCEHRSTRKHWVAGTSMSQNRQLYQTNRVIDATLPLYRSFALIECRLLGIVAELLLARDLVHCL